MPVECPPAPNADVFASALEACRGYLLYLANARLPGHLAPKAGASDIVQDTLVRAVAARDRFVGTVAELRAWLKGILMNELGTLRRRYRADCRDAGREVSVEDTPVPVACPHPVERLADAERVAAVTAAVGQLRDEARQVIVLRLELQLGFREIGERLGVGEDAARKAFDRAIARVREMTREHSA